MERTISSEERIRRAEEIYNRRKIQNGVRVSTSRVNTTSNSKLKLYKKLIKQILTCFAIYLAFYLVKNSNYIFSQELLNKTKSFLSYDIDFKSTYNSAVEYYNNNLKKFFVPIKENNKDIANEVTEEITNVESVGGIGGGDDQNIIVNGQVTETEAQPIVQLSQMEIDANYIKENCNLIIPLHGVISSKYGPRQGNAIVSSDHKGIDIAVNEGTVFIASMSGKVISASGEGSYGNHIFIQDGDVVTVYAHCKKLYVNEGEMVLQGQQLGEVGQTGNATGPHLHFEIRKDNRTVDPDMILPFA